MRFVARRWAAFLLVMIVGVWARAGTPIPTGVLGDSLAAEYQFATDPIDRQGARNFVELLAENNRLDFGTFSTANLGAPRLQGYTNNWASSGATTASLSAQTAGLVPQVVGGQVQLGIIAIGSNDFKNVFLGGGDPTTTIPAALTNTVTAAQTLLASSPLLKLAIANIPDITKVPIAQLLLAANPALAPVLAQLSASIDAYNAALAQQFSGNSRVAIVDVNGLLNNVIANPSTTIPGITFNTTTAGISPNHLFVDVLHPGTLAQGLLANEFVNAIDSKFGFDVQPLSVAEIKASAASAVPLPGSVWAALATLPLVLVMIRRHRIAA